MMSAVGAALQQIWEKNWPEVQAAATGGLPRFIIARRPRDVDAGVPVFCYHVVNAEAFAADLEFLAGNGYVTIDADTLLDHLEQRRPVPPSAVVLTIDDGARNLYEVAFPLLQRYGMKAVAFIATQFHQEEIEDASPARQNHLLHPLSWSQIRRMHTSGIIDFQSHTHGSRYVPRWPEAAGLEGSDPDVVHALRGPALSLAEDFRLAKEILERQLNKTVRHLAFPRFDGTAEALRIGRACGYEAFWWGVLPHRPGNRPGQSPLYVTRVDGRYLRRLPGAGRVPLSRVLWTRYRGSASRFRSQLSLGVRR
jgi:peptidoglycan/xylan/chitin deacetylase (PgdA/CDA1 family)